ncbi:hypothetical protein QO010_001860 [Caulobacter ginsengisoli]|uniref:Uncharacterized protein n=1 Tax=Caulobacter ginsengisoli TaxID=400775 RepID=A0ABU0IQ45_9CAUL|nr:hypothetical protein [Caulobacter ginsengisoli]MDQ0464089.1 hypothetical protein [Caulobacter ginsengisoli]
MNTTVRPLARLLIALVLTAVVSSAASQPAPSMRTVLGPVYSAAKLRAMPLLGVTLRMPLAEAEKVLAAQGVEKRYDHPHHYDNGSANDGEEVFFATGKIVTVTYFDLDGRRIVSGVSYMQDVAKNDPRSAEDWRRELTAQFGKPSRWLQWIGRDGKISDRMTFVASPALRDEEYAVNKVWSCSAGWACDRVRDGTDCRKVIDAAREPVLSLAFDAGGIHYNLDDYDLNYRSLMRTKAFRDQDVSKTYCIIPSVH